MRPWYFYTVLVCRDTLRLRGSLVTTLLILVGPCLALVLLLGFRAGLVRQQEDDLQKSPTACEVTAWLTSSHGSPLSRAALARWQGAHPECRCGIPDVQKVVSIQREPGGAELAGVTLLCTLPGDPRLAVHRADVLAEADRGIILARAVADQLHVDYTRRPEGGFAVAPGQTLTLTVRRGDDAQHESVVHVALTVRALIEAGDANIAYAPFQVLDWIEDFQQGRGVPALGWPAWARSAAVAYAGYLSFVKEPFDALDRAKLEARGLTVMRLEPAQDDHAERVRLGGLLAPHPLCVYYLSTGGSGTPQLTLTPQEVEDITDADDVVVPWTEPLEASVAGRRYRLVGVSLRKRWLRPFFADADAGFALGNTSLRLQFPRGGLAVPLPAAAGGTVPLVLDGGQTLAVPAEAPAVATLVPPGPASLLLSLFPAAACPVLLPIPALVPPLASAAPRVLVPADGLAQCRALQRGEVHYDAGLQLFAPAARENHYYKARFYARTLHEVPALDTGLRQAGFMTQSERTRIEEIQGYARTLDLLVSLVGGIVVLSGVWTLAAVLSDNTARKRGALGILRVLGVSRLGLCYFVAARAVFIGVIAGVLLVPVSLGAARFLTGHVALCELAAEHLAGVFALAVGASLVGVLWPAFQAARLDPAETVAQANTY
jgi:hypothetical protein